MQTIKLQSCDGEVIPVDLDVALQSRTIKKKVSFGLNDAVVKVSSDTCQIDSTLLKKVIEWATYHRNDEKYDKYPDDVVSWDADFLNVDKHTLFSLTAAANHLDIKGLSDVTCMAVANLMKGKSVEEMRETLNIKNDFTPEEEAKIRKENDKRLKIIAKRNARKGRI